MARPVYLGMTHNNALIALVLATSSVAAADSKPGAKPEPTDAKLAQLVGRWEGKSKFTVRGKTNEWTVTTSCERTTVGPSVLCNFVGVSGSMRLEEVWLFGYDANTALYHLFSVNTWGESYDHAGKWTDAAQVSFVHNATRDGKPMREEYRLTLKGDELTHYGVLSIDGKPIGEGTTIQKRIK